MNNQQSQDLYEKFNSELSVIEKDMAEIAQMAATVSDKFNGIGENIQSFASIPGFGRKGAVAATIVGGAVKIFGDLYADVKKEEALQKLLPKKVEIAEAKTSVIQNFLQLLNSHKEKFRLLLQQEINIEFNEEGRSAYKESHAESCQNSYSIYVRTIHMIEICNYMLEEFAAWKLGKHESSQLKPDKTMVLEDVLTMITTPEKLSDPKNDKLTGGIFLLSQNEPLFATLLNKLHLDAAATEKKKEKRVAKRRSFTEVKKFIRKLNKIEGSKDITHLDWIRSYPIFTQAEKTFKLTKLYPYLLKYYGIGYFIVILYLRSSMRYGAIDMIFSAIFFSFIVSNIAILFSLIIFYLYENNDSGKGSVYYLLFLTFTVLTLGLMPIAFKRYLKREEEYEDFLVQLKLKINE